jgi:Fe-S-cluster containining protein
MTIEPCENCGLCCEHLIVEADAVDVLREPQIETARPLGRRAVSLSVLDACWILAGPGMPCSFLMPDKRCAIYPKRPHACVAFVPGIPQCQELRKEHGLPPVVLQPAVHQILTEIMEAAIAEKLEDPDLE